MLSYILWKQTQVLNAETGAVEQSSIYQGTVVKGDSLGFAYEARTNKDTCHTKHE